MDCLEGSGGSEKILQFEVKERKISASWISWAVEI